ncbi:uncharacterized protein LOC106050802 [Biomphalaria glabrata]|uniref:Uncharacterized protein LOC106050802 n=1 Tax=Biomphalaria glabrata TaxID=6526 RepID=A0A9W3BGD3_BIOGL|nr:uncharacterized protein LOC106050802 [Biomphalaria glabrata]
MTLRLFVVLLLITVSLVAGANVTDNEQESNESEEIQTTAIQDLNNATSVETELERNKKSLPAVLRGLVSVFCLSFSRLPGRSVRSDLDLHEQLEIRAEKRAAPIIVAARLLCAANTLNNVRNFCRSLTSGKRDILHPEDVVDGEEPAHQPQKRIGNILLNLARPVCDWLRRHGRDTDNAEDLYSGTEHEVDRRDLGETWNF